MGTRRFTIIIFQISLNILRYQRKKRLPANRGAVFSVHLFSVHTAVYCRRHSYLFTKNNLKVVCAAEAHFIYNALNRLIACTQEFFRPLYPEPVHAVAQPPTETLFELAAEIIFTVAAAFRDFLQIDSLIKMVLDILVDGFSKRVLRQPALKLLQLLTKHFIAFYQNKADIVCIAAGEQHLFILQKLCTKPFLFFYTAHSRVFIHLVNELASKKQRLLSAAPIFLKRGKKFYIYLVQPVSENNFLK